MRQFFVATNPEKDKDSRYTNKIREYLEGKGCTCQRTPDGWRLDEPLMIPEGTECIIVLGGDGTLLRVARSTHMLQIPLIGINLGTLGYLTDINKDAIYPAMDKLINDDYVIEHRIMLYGKVIRNGEVILRDTALNDIVISRGGHSKMIYLENYINGHILNKFRADGVIVSTPTGSTGYSLSAGGPIIAPDADLLLLTPLAPQSLIDRSVVIKSENGITVKLGQDKGGPFIATVVFDGDTILEIESGDEIEIKKSKRDTLIAKISDTSFLEVLYAKMNPQALTEVMK